MPKEIRKNKGLVIKFDEIFDRIISLENRIDALEYEKINEMNEEEE